MNPKNLKDGELRCHLCNRYFRDDSAFDRHKVEGKLFCNDPARIGLVKNKRGVWTIPLPRKQ